MMTDIDIDKKEQKWAKLQRIIMDSKIAKY